MLYVFDLDGTLIDSQAAVIEAYRAAGVDMPADAWGAPVGDWCSPAQHELKQKLYPKMLQEYAYIGPARQLWNYLVQDERCIATGASRKSADAALEFLGIDPAELALCGASTEAKAEFIEKKMSEHDMVIYVDSDHAIGRSMQWRTKCAILTP